MNVIDRVIVQLAPSWGVSRMRARAVVDVINRHYEDSGRRRHYEAAQGGRRTDGWKRANTDANAANGPAIQILRNHARDLVRNNPWAERGKHVIANNTVGWGIVPEPTAGPRASNKAVDLWRAWAGSTQCDATGQQDMGGLQRLVISTVAESGEAIIQRYRRPLSEGLAIPLQLQVLEGDFIDTGKDAMRTEAGGRIVQGIEYDALGRRVAYWLYPEHPGANYQFSRLAPGRSSRRISASDVLHVYRIDRAGQARGITWYKAVIARLKNFDEFEDAELLRQKIAACLAGFITSTDGVSPAMGAQSAANPVIETIEPGTLSRLAAGQSVEFTSPPSVTDSGFSDRTLAAVAMGLGITVEDLTGNYRQMPFSAARMSRLAHWANVHAWRWQMLVPMFCGPAYRWAMETAYAAGSLWDVPDATWTAPPMPVLEPDKEALALARMVRTGMITVDEMIREQGGNPEQHWPAYAKAMDRLDELKIILDSDPRRTTQAGQPREPTAVKPKGAARSTERLEISSEELETLVRQMVDRVRAEDAAAGVIGR